MEKILTFVFEVLLALPFLLAAIVEIDAAAIVEVIQFQTD